MLTIAAAVFPDSLRAGTGSFASLSLMTQTNDPQILRDNKSGLHPGICRRSGSRSIRLPRACTCAKGVKFSDGTDFTADDVAYSLNFAARSAKPPMPMAARINQIAKRDRCRQAHRRHQDQGRCSRRCMRGLSDIVMEPKHYFEKVGVGGCCRACRSGTGPFIFEEWVPGDRYTLTANRNYWGGAPKIDKLVIRTIPDGSTSRRFAGRGRKLRSSRKCRST